MAAGQISPGALDGAGHGVYGLILADDMLFQGFFQALQAAVLGLFNFDGGDTGPQLDDLGHIVHRDLNFGHLQLQGGQFLALLGQFRLNRSQGLVVDGGILAVLRLGVLQLMFAAFQLGYTALGLHQLGNFGVAQVAAGAGLVQQVDGLIGQEAVGDVPLRQFDHVGDHGVRHADAVVLLVVDADAFQHLDGIGDGRLLDFNGLETALQRSIFLDIFAVLGKSGRTDDLHLPAGEGGLHDVGSVHGAVRIARAHDGMNFIDEQDDVAGGLDLADKALDPLLELTTELGARNEGGHIQQEDLLVPQAGGHLALGNALGDALGDGSLADTGLTDQAGVVLLAAAQDLDGAVNFAVAANDAVHLAVPGLLGQVLTVGIQELALGGFVLFTVFAFGLVVAALAGCTKAKREHRRTAGHKIVLTVALLGGVLTCCGGQHTGLGSLLQEAAHAFFHVFQVLVGHAELFHQIIHGLDVHLAGAGQAVALLHWLAVVHPLDEHHGRAFFAAYTNHNFFTSIENARYRRIVLQIL